MSLPHVSFDKPVPFDITIPQARLDKLQKHIDLVELEEDYLGNVLQSQQDDVTQYGLPPKKLKALLERLKDGFDWRKQEEGFKAMGEHVRVALNGLPSEDTFSIHAVHRRSDKPNAIPLILVHGWPGDVYEFSKIAPLLTDAGFHVVAPSLPGYAYSDAPKQAKGKGDVPWTLTDTALCLDAVMRALGYDRYVAQGGDWGGIIVRRLAQILPDRVRSIHVNHLMIRPDTKKPNPNELSDVDKRGMERRDAFIDRGSSYADMQGAVPYTLGAALSVSPIATIAYIAEKHYRWSGPETQPSLDDILTHTLLYWLTGKVTSSFWLYYNRKHREGDGMEAMSTAVKQPAAIGLGAHEIYWPPRSIVEPYFSRIESFRLLEEGGHFLAFEAPRALADDMIAHFSKHGID